MGSSNKKKSTVGYKYYINLHLAICNGRIDALREIWFADKKAWSGDLRYKVGDSKKDSETRVYINNPYLFGGEDSEGGVSGSIGVGFGSQEQQMDYVNADGTYSPRVPVRLPTATIVYNGWVDPPIALNYRGLAIVNFYRFYIGTNPYLKDMSFLVERYWDEWYPEKARIGDNANGVHIIYEALVNSDWGLGYKASTIDDVSFRKAADILYTEGLGLSLLWDAEQELTDFIEDVKTCIDATFFLNRRTGLWTIKLIRAGEPSVLTISPANATLESLQRRALGDTYNEMSVKYTNPETEDYATLTVQDLANIQSQGRAVQQTKEYLGVRDAATAAMLAQRDLQAASATLLTASATVNRQAWGVNPGDVIALLWPDEGIVSLDMRVVDTTQAEPGSDSITLTLVEDVFGQNNASFVGVQPPGYEPQDTEPELFDPQHPWEFPFWYIWQYLGQPIDSYAAGTAYSTVLGGSAMTAARSEYLYAFQQQTDGSSAWTQVGTGDLTPTASTKKIVPANATSVIDFEDLTRFADIEENSFALLCGDTVGGPEEIVQVISADWTAKQITVARGLMDTPPRSWPAGTHIFFLGTDRLTVDATVRARGEVVQYRPAMLTSNAMMDLNDVPTTKMTLKGRFDLPYPVANVTIEGGWWPSKVSVGATMAVSWSTRNRLLQDGLVQVKWGEASITPETGTTWGYELYDVTSGDRISGAEGSYEWSFAVDVTPIANKGETKCKLVIFAERDGYRNYADFEHTLNITAVTASGYGKSYGKGYGKA